MNEWQPIETAPNDIVFVTDGRGVFIGIPNQGRWTTGWVGDNFSFIAEIFPTHWLQIPSILEAMKNDS